MKSLLTTASLIGTVGIMAALAACASGGGGHGARCTPEARDTLYRASGVVYRDCAVDRAARALASNPKPSFTPNTNSGPTCYSADFEFVVDERGRPEPQTIHTMHRSDDAFATSVAQVIPSFVYEPALKGGQPVKQIVDYKQSMSVAKMVVPAGAPVRPPAPRPAAC